MFHMLSHLENANQNSTEILSLRSEWLILKAKQTNKKENKGLRDDSMVKVVKALSELSEDRGLDISTHMAASNSSYWDLMPSSDLQRSLSAHGAHPSTHAHICT